MVLGIHVTLALAEEAAQEALSLAAAAATAETRVSLALAPEATRILRHEAKKARHEAATVIFEDPVGCSLSPRGARWM